jgi:cytochrome d ubiquinol oxidase subunit I
MQLDPVYLSRLQFALTIGFHYLFPPLTIGLGLLMVIMEGLFLKTRDHQYEAMAKFWTRIFGLTFAVGVASGIVMEFQFGTNWATYSRYVGDIFGSALAAEGIFAFFLESGFLAVLVFGWDRVRPRTHFIATCMVSLGSMFSAIWIVVANSWQQTPAGYHLVGDGPSRRAEVTDFWVVVFNPSTADRLVHVLIGAFILGGFFVMSVSAYYLLRRQHEEFARRSFRIALPFATVFSIASLVSGDHQARNVGFQQPAKLAAFEGHFRSRDRGTPLYLWGVPDAPEQRVKYGLAVPGLLSFLMYHRWDTPVRALDTYAPQDWPPVGPVFQTYHLMVALGVLFIILTLYACILAWRGTLLRKRWLLWIFVFAIAGPMIANQLGWASAELGRQPWIVWGLLRTNEAASKAVTGPEVLASIIVFSVIYLMLLLVWLFVMDRKIKAGPEAPQELAAEARKRGWLTVAAEFAAAKGPSLTDAHHDATDKTQ